MILECEEQEEGEQDNKYLRNFISKRQKVDGFISKLMGSVDVQAKSLKSLQNLKSDRSLNPTCSKGNAIMEKLDECSSDDN